MSLPIYSLIEIYPSLYLAKIEDQYDQSLLFCRYCEWQESPYANINHQPFKFLDLIKTYTINSKWLTFDYMSWGGFNVPSTNVLACSATIPAGDRNVYDDLMSAIVTQINKPNNPWYLIGVTKEGGGGAYDTYYHEACHGLYSLDSNYKLSADNITNSISPGLYHMLQVGLSSNDYGLNVTNDEIQAYMSTGPSVFRGIIKNLTSAQKIEYKQKRTQYVNLYRSYVFPKIKPFSEINL